MIKLNEESLSLITTLEGIIEDVKASEHSHYEMWHIKECVYAKTYGKACNEANLSDKLGFEITCLSIDRDDYEKGLTQPQALIASLFTSKYGEVLTKDEWLEEANIVLDKLKLDYDQQ